MQVFIGLFWKDFMSFFRTYIGYALIFFYLCLSALSMFFFGDFFMINNSGFYSFFVTQPFLMIFFTPLLMSKIFSFEEDKNGNFEFLFTQPIRYTTILFAKYFAGYIWSALLALCAVFLYMGTSSIIQYNFVSIFIGYFSLLMLSAIFCALSCMANILVKNFIGSFIIGILLCFVFWIIDFDLIAGMILNAFNIISPFITDSLSLSNNYNLFIHGEISLSAILYFISSTAVICFMAYLIFMYKQSSCTKSTLYRCIALIFVSHILLAISFRLLFSSFSIDITKSKEYTLTDKSQEICQNLQQHIHIKLYISDRFSIIYPDYAPYIQYVENMLEKYASATDKISIEIINPLPYSTFSEEAKQYGIEPILDDDGNPVYFGATFISENNLIKTIPVFIKERKQLLEQDITNILYFSGNNYQKKTIGIISENLPILRKTYKKKFQNWAFIEKLSEFYNFKKIGVAVSEIPDDIDLLMLINPHKIPEYLHFTLDQYVMRGGKIIIFADPYSEIEAEYYSSPQAKKTDINNFLQHYGLQFDADNIVTNYKNSVKLKTNNGDLTDISIYPLWMTIADKNITFEDVKGKLHTIFVKSAGSINILDTLSDDAEFITLIEASENNGIIPANKANLNNQAINKTLLSPTDEKFILAGIIKGKFWSAFDNNIISNDSLFLKRSIADSKIALIGDSDLLYNDSFVNKDTSISNSAYMFAENYDNLQFLLNLIGYMLDDNTAQIINKPIINSNYASANEIIRHIVSKPYEKEIINNTINIEDADLYIKNMTNYIHNSGVFVEPNDVKNLNQIKQKREELIKEKQKLDYFVKTDFDKKKTSLIMTTILEIPLIIVILIYLLFIIQKKFTKLRIRRIMQ